MQHRGLAIVAIAFAALSVAGCGAPTVAADDPSSAVPTASPASPSSTPKPTPTSAPTPAATVVSVPTGCRELVSPAYYAANFANLPLNDPILVDPAEAGAVVPVTPVDGATTAQNLKNATALRCFWRDPAADLTGLEVTVANADAGITTPYLNELSSQGYTCVDVSDGRQCQKISLDPYYPANDSETIFVREGIYVSIVEGNYRGENGLIADIAATLWP